MEHTKFDTLAFIHICEGTMPTVKVLYNDCYGGFDLSMAFKEEYEKRTGAPLEILSAYVRVGANSVRCDPMAIKLFEEKGSEWCSGPHSSLEVHEFPDVFANYWEIEEYDGNENVRILVNDALADVLHTFMDTGDHAVMKRQYTAIMEAKKQADGVYELKKDTPKPEENGYDYYGICDSC
jgi:hypothetical protein